ncbi:malonyl-CoA decarboxylase, partial [Blyttiomyces helicus]
EIVHYESVHAVPTWQSLKQRLGPGRLCYAFFHPSMPQEPLTFVQVALVEKVADDVQVILNDPSPGHGPQTVAIFYSISSSQREGSEGLREALAGDAWVQDQRVYDVVKPILLRLASRYILLEKKRTFALDPVANFHVRNGACVYRMNWMGDSSAKGLAQSYGIMCNYHYDLPRVESNNQQYLLDGSIAV